MLFHTKMSYKEFDNLPDQASFQIMEQKSQIVWKMLEDFLKSEVMRYIYNLRYSCILTKSDNQYGFALKKTLTVVFGLRTGRRDLDV